MSKKSVPDSKRILNCLPSQNTEQDWGIETAVDAGLVADANNLPASTDLRADWWEIGDQRDTGSCVGWAVTDAAIRWHMVKSNRIQPADHLSVRYIWMAAKETDEFTQRPTSFIESDGTSLKAALDIARKYGVVLDTLFPFKGGKLYSGTAAVFYAIAAQNRISSYYNLGRNAIAWRQWLANYGPIVTRLNVDQTWYNCTQNGGNLDVYDMFTAGGGHAVTLVGYLNDRFIIRNSWGEAWGDKGFAYASLDYSRVAFTEAYGVAVA